MTQGQSIETPHKLRGIDAAMRMQLAIAGPILRRQSFARYFHFDLFAGSGINDKIDGCDPLPGSPIVAANILRASDLNYILVAIEVDRFSAKSLKSCLLDDPNVFVVESDNRDILPAVPDVIRQYRENPSKAIGSVLIDPNKPSDVDWTAINAMLAVCNRLDVIVNFPGTAEKRKRYANIDHNLLDDLPDLCARNYWLIRDAAVYGNHQFCLCVGRNHEYGDYQREGFVRWDSDAGKIIRSRISNNEHDHRMFLEKFQGQKRLF